ncbi:MAG: hypothetical protein IJ888_03190 [Prevotella sp.]|nr:hypothetical protein [Prevotella sp.]
MKSKNILITGLLMLLPSAVPAQQQIQQAFDALRNSNIKEISSRHSVEKDPDLGTMEGLEDTYDFELTDNRDKRLIDNIRKAFELDEAHAYSVSTGSNGNSEDFVSLAVGDSNKGGVAIGLIKDSKWIYACFLDPNDTLRQHRYAYALEWAENGNKIRGRIVKTYATTLKFRQSKKQSRTITVNGNNFAFGSFFSDADTKPSETWLSEFNTYKNLFLKNPDGNAANSYATQIYRLCKDAKSLEDVEKNIVATEIVKLKKKTKDEFIQQLFDMSIERLKK